MICEDLIRRTEGHARKQKDSNSQHDFAHGYMPPLQRDNSEDMFLVARHKYRRSLHAFGVVQVTTREGTGKESELVLDDTHRSERPLFGVVLNEIRCPVKDASLILARSEEDPCLTGSGLMCFDSNLRAVNEPAIVFLVDAELRRHVNNLTAKDP